MTLKSGLEFSILNFELGISELLLPSANKFPERLKWPGQLAETLKRLVSIHKKKSIALLTPFLSQKWLLQGLTFHFIYEMSSSWCECQNKK